MLTKVCGYNLIKLYKVCRYNDSKTYKSKDKGKGSLTLTKYANPHFTPLKIKDHF